MMNQYGFWNARGTSNSEYGKFNFLHNMQQQAPTSQYGAFNLGGNGWGSGGYGQQQQQHQPDCQNVHQGYYGQQQGYTPQNYYHQPGCPNAAQNKWAMQSQGQMQMQGQQQDGGSQPRFTIEVGEEAAAAALGGKAQFHNHFSMPQQHQGAPMTSMMMTQQEGQEEGTGDIEQPSGNNNLEPNTCSAADESAAAATASGNPGETGGDPPSGAGDQGDPTGNNASGAAGDSAPSARPTPQPQAAAAKPGKWRGLSSVKYGRNAPPQMRHGDMSKQMQQLENKMHHLQFVPGEMPPANPRMMSAKSSTTMANNSSGQEQPRGGRNRPLTSVAPKPNLCGKCNKCKAILPPDMGLPTLTFPSRSSMNIKTPNTGARSKHYLGRQDAQNFRAVNYRDLRRM